MLRRTAGSILPAAHVASVTIRGVTCCATISTPLPSAHSGVDLGFRTDRLEIADNDTAFDFGLFANTGCASEVEAHFDNVTLDFTAR